MKVLKKIYTTIRDFSLRISEDNVSLYSAQASYFIILSIFPLILLLFTLIGFTSIPQEALFQAVKEILPSTLDQFLEQIISDIYSKNSGTIISITSITSLWAASKGVFAIVTGMYCVYHIPDKRNYIISRFLSIIYTFIFIVVIVFTLGIIVFGNKLYSLLASKLPILYDIIDTIFGNRTLIALCVLTLFFLMIYKTVHKSGYSLGELLPGSILSSIGWMAFSYLFSIYVDHFSHYSNMYGSLTTIVILMLWLYVCMFIIFLGGELNVFFKENILTMQKLKRKIKNRKSSS